MRIAPAALLIALAACAPDAAPDAPGAGAEPIDCRIDGAAGFAPVCTVERAETEAGRILTVRKPDGGFRRLLVVDEGGGLLAADGAEPAEVTIAEPGLIEVAIGGDFYRLPASVRAP